MPSEMQLAGVATGGAVHRADYPVDGNVMNAEVGMLPYSEPPAGLSKGNRPRNLILPPVLDRNPA